MLVMMTGKRTGKKRRRWRTRNYSTSPREVKPMLARCGTQMGRTLPPSTSTKASSSPTSTTSASWQKKARRRYIKDLLPNTLPPMISQMMNLMRRRICLISLRA
jgi:hypothetical protein